MNIKRHTAPVLTALLLSLTLSGCVGVLLGGAAVGTNRGRLPKTGEAPFALNFAGTAAGFLLAAYALCGRRRKEQ